MADVNGDGLLDFAIANQWAQSTFYWNHSPRAGAFLGLSLLVPNGPVAGATARVLRYPITGLAARPAIGADVSVRLSKRRTLIGEVDGGNGGGSANAPEVLLGLGRTYTDPLAVDVAWRSVGGALEHVRLELRPGWHTVVLGGKR